jgi:hypothetical protein
MDADQKKIFLSNEAQDFKHLEKLAEYLEAVMPDMSSPSSAPWSWEPSAPGSWDVLREKLKSIINNEDKHEPLSDQQIAEKLKEQGIELEWRKVRRYRQVLGIAPPTKRREV